MSRIDTRSEPMITARPMAKAKATSASNATKAAEAAGAAQGLRGLKSKISQGLKARSKRMKRLAAATEIVEADLEPLSGKKRDDLVGELSRIMGRIEEIEEMVGSDNTSVLCKVMIREQVRRLMLVEDGQSDAAGLKGTA